MQNEVENPLLADLLTPMSRSELRRSVAMTRDFVIDQVATKSGPKPA